jgi:hypothetical protein
MRLPARSSIRMMRRVKPSLVMPKSNGLVKNQEVEIQLDLFHHVDVTLLYASPVCFSSSSSDTKDLPKIAADRQQLVITYRANSCRAHQIRLRSRYHRHKSSWTGCTWKYGGTLCNRRRTRWELKESKQSTSDEAL